ncbi:hypothetical protein CN171_20565 [Sinorhizobium meliloti]|nr:hypothetical protein CN171_20565 [Sinorhizobium meliloti]
MLVFGGDLSLTSRYSIDKTRLQLIGYPYLLHLENLSTDDICGASSGSRRSKSHFPSTSGAANRLCPRLDG